LAFVLFSSRLKLKAIHRFTSTATAVEDITAIQSGKLGKGLKQFLTDEIVDKGKGKESLVVIDPHLGSFSSLNEDVIPYESLCCRSFNFEETEHKCQCYGGRQTYRPLAWNSRSNSCSTPGFGPQGFGDNESWSESLIIAVGFMNSCHCSLP
jgi:hypothetical protein